MQVFHPSEPSHFAERNALLQDALRPEPLPFPIESEYPLVLAAGGAHTSYCLAEEERVVAHANLWPRILEDRRSGERLPIGLVGNVATRADCRGRGLMQKLFGILEERARSDGLGALVLWSDLLQFYQKLGFGSFGRELRLFYTRDGLRRLSLPTRQFLPAAGSLSSDEASALLAIRHPTSVTVKRSTEEFLRLLTIPATDVLVARAAGRPAHYCIMGKGYDMAGVIHEWGAATPEDLLAGVLAMMEYADIEQSLLLAPGDVARDWRAALEKPAYAVEPHAMALARPLSDEAATFLDRCFIWGLDSI